MAQPARSRRAEAPPVDPHAVERAYRLERARRRARIRRDRERRLASLRFATVLLFLLAVTIALSLAVWNEIERLFGL